MRRLVALLTNLFRGRRVDRDTEAELSEYLAHAEDAYEARGLSPADARRAARLDSAASRRSPKAFAMPGRGAESKRSGGICCTPCVC